MWKTNRSLRTQETPANQRFKWWSGRGRMRQSQRWTLEARYRPKSHSGTKMKTTLPTTSAIESVDHPLAPNGITPSP